MKTFLINIQVEFTCADEEIARDRVLGIPFGDHDCGFAITGIVEGELDAKDDETLKPEYRERHGLSEYQLERVWSGPGHLEETG